MTCSEDRDMNFMLWTADESCRGDSLGRFVIFWESLERLSLPKKKDAPHERIQLLRSIGRISISNCIFSQRLPRTLHFPLDPLTNASRTDAFCMDTGRVSSSGTFLPFWNLHFSSFLLEISLWDSPTTLPQSQVFDKIVHLCTRVRGCVSTHRLNRAK